MMTAGAFPIHKDFLLQSLASACLFAAFSLIVTELKNLYTSFFGFQRAREAPFLMERLMCLGQQKSLAPTGRNQDKKIV